MNRTRLLDDEPVSKPARVLVAEDETAEPTHEEIADLAYQYWEERGGAPGSPWEDWFRAEQELKKRH